MAAWPQTDRKRTLAQFKFGSGVSGLFIEEHCHLLLEALKQSHEFTSNFLAIQYIDNRMV